MKTHGPLTPFIIIFYFNYTRIFLYFVDILSLLTLTFLCFSAWHQHGAVSPVSQAQPNRTLRPDTWQHPSTSISGLCSNRWTGFEAGQTPSGRRRLLQGLLYFWHRLQQKVSKCVGLPTKCCIWNSTNGVQQNCWVSAHNNQGLPVELTHTHKGLKCLMFKGCFLLFSCFLILND